jgi:YidC/Oxa1 family membrane protein insertase
LLQIPIFFSLYKVIFLSIEIRHHPFWGWIKDLSSQDPTTIVNLFGLIPFNPPSFLHLGIWPILMGLTMFVQQKQSMTTMDEMQRKNFYVYASNFNIRVGRISIRFVNLLDFQQWF